MTIDELEKSLRSLLAGKFTCLSISFNDHAVNYQDAQTAINEGDYEHADWVSEDEKERAKTENSVWVLQWYPTTPVGFCAVAASSLSACVTHALEAE